MNAILQVTSRRNQNFLLPTASPRNHRGGKLCTKEVGHRKELVKHSRRNGVIGVDETKNRTQAQRNGSECTSQNEVHVESRIAFPASGTQISEEM